MSDLLKLENIGKQYNDGDDELQALTGVSLTVNPGEFVAITGRSGSGKSTLLNLAGCLVQPSEGRVFIDGVESDWSAKGRVSSLRRSHVGMVFQQLNLLSSLTAIENVALPIELDGMRSKDAYVLALDALKSVDLGHKANAFTDELSGGQQQRIAIARALVGERRLLLADEPTGSVDDETGDDIVRLLRQQTQQGAAVVMVTHDAAYAARADRIVHLRDGKVASETAPKRAAKPAIQGAE